MLDNWSADEIQELEEIRAILPLEGREPGEVVQVKLLASATDTGTLKLVAVSPSGGERWNVEFNVRVEQKQE